MRLLTTRRNLILALLPALALLAPIATVAADPLASSFIPARREAQRAFEQFLLDSVSADTLRAYHDALASEPHVAGSDGDQQVINFIADHFSSLGLDVEKHEILVYLAKPFSASLDIVSPEPISLPIIEEPLPEDPFSQRERLHWGYNAYSGNGDVTAPLVYANYGRKEDFEKLAELGIDVKGKIVIARYGGNYRGYKAKFAEAAGAAGLIIFTDPVDSGFTQGLMYPEGGFANDTTIQRGSIATLPYTGDPLTPFVPATPEANRLRPDEVALPRIPVQPIGWRSAHEILSRMKGPAVPTAETPRESWQGGLPFTYRLTSGETDLGEPAVTVRLAVQQLRSLVPTANVLGALRGERFPEQTVIFGCHHDAWIYGAQDPTCGTILVLEAARLFAEAAKRGFKPDRTILFATWGAEEFGIIGSAEWVEANHRSLTQNAVAYFNADAATFGMQFRASASPSLKSLIAAAASQVYSAPPDEPDLANPDNQPGADSPASGGRGFTRLLARPRFGDLGGGSDHVGFLCHAGVPAAGLSATGARGNAYHSIYDNLHWYRQTVGDDYEPAKHLTRAACLMLARLASADALPLDPAQTCIDFREHIGRISARAETLEVKVDFTDLIAASERAEEAARAAIIALSAAIESTSAPGDARLARATTALMALDRLWYSEPGLPGRPWFRNLFAAPDETAGYAPWMLPLLRWTVENRDPNRIERAKIVYTDILTRLERDARALESSLQ